MGGNIFGAFGHEFSSGNSDDDAQLEGMLEGIGIQMPKDPFKTDIREEVKAKAEELWEKYSAYLQAGFNPSEAIHIVIGELKHAD